MTPRFCALAAAVLLFPLSCSSQNDETDTAGSPAEAAAPAAAANFTGTYHVSGRTEEESSGRGRDISGTVILTQEGDAYTASFEFETLFPSAEGPTSAQVVGTGKGMLEGGKLLGTADTQIILAQVPGVNADFGFLPRRYGPRITSRSVAEWNDDGSVTIEIKSEAAEGAAYQSTRTTVRGNRIANAR